MAEVRLRPRCVLSIRHGAFIEETRRHGSCEVLAPAYAANIAPCAATTRYSGNETLDLF